MSTSDCRRVSCCGENGVEFSAFQYSLVLGETYQNPEFTLVYPCPEGYDCTAPSVTIVIPPGTIKFTPTTINPNPPKTNDPWNPASGTYTFECGSQTLTITTDGLGFTEAQITQIVNFLANCQAEQDAITQLEPNPITTPNGQPGIRLWNTEQSCTATCPEGETGDPVTVTVPANTNSTVIVATSTPLERYLAQQELNNAALAEACADAAEELVCAGPECPQILDSVAAVTSGCIQCAYDPVNDWVFVSNSNNQTVVKINASDNSILGTTASFGAFVGGIVYVPGPTTIDANPALLVATGAAELYHVDPVTMTATLLTALADDAITAIEYASAADKVFIPISLPTGGMDVYTVSSGALAHINGTTIPLSVTYNSALGEIYTTNFDTTTYPGMDVLAIDQASLAVTKQLALSISTDAPGTRCLVYCSSNAMLYCGTHASSGPALNKAYVIDAAAFTESTIIDLPTQPINLAPILNYDPNLNIVMAGVVGSALADGSIEVINPLDNTIICSLSEIYINNRGAAVTSNTSFYAHVRAVVDDLSITQFGQP